MDKFQAWRQPRLSTKQDEIVEKLLHQVWGFNSPSGASPAKKTSYFNHYWRLLHNEQLLGDYESSLRDSKQKSEDVIYLIDTFLKIHANTPIKDVRDRIRANSPQWLLDDTVETLDRVLQFACRMWLFITPQTHDETATLQQSIQRTLDAISAGSSTWLWLDFSADALQKQAGFRIVWTNEITEHLTFESRSVIRVFSKSAALRHAQNNSANSFYPPGLQVELRRTLNLLWPIGDSTIAKTVKSLEDTWAVDIEASMGQFERYNLSTYPIFGDRLEKIQQRLEHEHQRRSNSRGIQIAVYGIVLTAIFGLVSMVTGVVQMWASLQALHSPPNGH